MTRDGKERGGGDRCLYELKGVSVFQIKAGPEI